MPRGQPPYGPEFWAEAVRLTGQPGNTTASVARDLGVSYDRVPSLDRSPGTPLVNVACVRLGVMHPQRA